LSNATTLRLFALTALALVGAIVALAVRRHDTARSATGTLPAAAPAPGGGWYRALAAAAPLVTKPRSTVCGHTLGPKTIGVAHPVLPCNVKLYVEYGGKEVLTEVVDRGPYVSGREFAFTHALAEALGLHGTQPIRWRFAAAPSQ
jgi:rare lipoprotein A (RlpA)-like double-psi beta-barrel protein